MCSFGLDLTPNLSASSSERLTTRSREKSRKRIVQLMLRSCVQTERRWYKGTQSATSLVGVSDVRDAADSVRSWTAEQEVRVGLVTEPAFCDGLFYYSRAATGSELWQYQLSSYLSCRFMSATSRFTHPLSPPFTESGSLQADDAVQEGVLKGVVRGWYADSTARSPTVLSVHLTPFWRFQVFERPITTAGSHHKQSQN